MFGYTRDLIVATAGLLSFFAASQAIGEIPANERFLVRLWQSEDGLPSNVVRAVAQSADGYLWVATAEGVVRFDGIRFSGFVNEPDAVLAQRPARALFAMQDGDVWVATARGGLLRWTERRLRVVLEDAPATVPANRLTQVTQVVSDAMAGGTVIEKGEELLLVSASGPPKSLPKTPALAERLRANAEALAQRSSSAPGGGTLQIRDRSGRLWSATPGRGLEVSEGNAAEVLIPLPEFGPGTRITTLLEGREGNLWAASGNGVYHLRPRRVQVFGAAHGLADRTIFALMQDSTGTLWAGSKSGGMDRIENSRVTHIDLGDGGPNRPISALYEDRDGTVWAATRNGSVFRWREGAFHTATSSEMPLAKVLAIAQDAEGALWFGGEQGLAAWRRGTLTRYGAAEGVATQHITALTTDPAGTPWVGSADGWVYRWSQGRFESVAEPNALKNRWVSALLPENDGSVWITTLGAGLFHWQDGRLFQFSERQGLTDARLTCVLDDTSGYLWLGSLTGIIRIAKAELAEVAAKRRDAVNCLTLDRSDGMLSRECTGGFQPAGWRGRDGTLWFPTVNGIASVRPDRLELNAVPPPVAIEEARLNGKVAQIGETVLTTGPGRSRLEFLYTALSFTAPDKVRFRLVLEGLDGAEWQDVGPQRSAAFEAVPPGRYRFRVRAANADGVWNEAGATVAVKVLPHVWETAWFRAAMVFLAAALAVGVGWMVARARMRGRLMRLEMQTSREKERARIAQDLHDDLGASLTEISMLAHLAAEDETRGAGRAPLPEIAAKADRLVGALDEIVWAVNPRHDTLASLIDYVAAFAAEFLETAGIALRLEIPRGLPAVPLDAEIRHSLFLAIREALNNVVKHSGATAVRLRVQFGRGQLQIAVADNGRGLSTDAGEFNEGLRNIRARMARIGGDCRIESDASGTAVSFALPLAEGSQRAQ